MQSNCYAETMAAYGFAAEPVAENHTAAVGPLETDRWSHPVRQSKTHRGDSVGLFMPGQVTGMRYIPFDMERTMDHYFITFTDKAKNAPD